MKNTKYDKIADLHKPNENKFLNAIIAFLSGGFLGFLAELFIELLCFYLGVDRVNAGVYVIVLFIFIGSLFTALGFFDKLVNIFRCGLLIPITGFAHSMTSSCLDARSEGFIYGIGSNIFKLAGSVILYGVVFSSFFAMIRYMIGGIG